MTVSREEIERIATLAAVVVEPAEMDQLVRDVDAIVDYVGKLSAVDADVTLPTYRPGPAHAPLRTDVVAPIELTGPVADIAPQSRDGFFLVPRIDGAGGK